MISHWPQSLVEMVARRRAIAVLGAGTSFHSIPLQGSHHPPDWPHFLNNAAKGLKRAPKTEARKLVASAEYLSACELIKTHLQTEWPTVLQNSFGVQKLKPGQLHEKIYNLDLPIIMTTNFDKVYEGSASTFSNPTVKIKTYKDSDLAFIARGDAKSRTTLKVHGSIDDVSSMIFTRSDYVKLRTKHPLFQLVVKSLAVTNVFIFVGCGLRDPDLILMLEDLAAVSGGFGEHYAVIDSSQSKEIESVYKECFNLRCVRYKWDASFHASEADRGFE